METITQPKVRAPARPPVHAPDALPVVSVGARVFVWGVWALTLGTLLAFVAQNSNNVPWSDDLVVSWAKKHGAEPENGETVNIRGNVFWQDQPSQEDFATDIWVNDTIDSFRVRPDDKPSMIQLSSIELLVPHGS